MMARKKASKLPWVLGGAVAVAAAGALAWWAKKRADAKKATQTPYLAPFVSLTPPLVTGQQQLVGQQQLEALPVNVNVEIFADRWHLYDPIKRTSSPVSEITIRTGGFVHFRNRDKINYSVTVPGVVDYVLGPGEGQSIRFSKPGVFVSTDRMQSTAPKLTIRAEGTLVNPPLDPGGVMTNQETLGFIDILSDSSTA